MTDIEEIRKFIDCNLRSNYNGDNVIRHLNNPYFELDKKDKQYADLFLKGVSGRDRCLEFGSGNGRWLEYFSQYFKQVDGCDISHVSLSHVKDKLTPLNIKHELYEVDYESLKAIPDDTYDLVYSITVFQHLPVYSLRKMYMQQLYDKLKTGGVFVLQICSGSVRFKNEEWGTTSTYYEDSTETRWTNSRHDVCIDDINFLKKDLDDIGFSVVDISEIKYEDTIFACEVENESFMNHEKVVLARCLK